MENIMMGEIRSSFNKPLTWSLRNCPARDCVNLVKYDATDDSDKTQDEEELCGKAAHISFDMS